MVSTNLVTVLAIERVKSEPRANGDQVVAALDVQIPHLMLVGCVLIQTLEGDLRIYPPEARSRKYDRAPIKITSSDLHRQLLNAAVRAWRGLDDPA